MREDQRDEQCVRCGADQIRVISLRLRGVPHREAGHQTVYDYAHISACDECGWGQYLSHSHDCWDSSHEEPWDMEWSWSIGPEGIGVLRTGLARCPQPGSATCTCRIHAALRRSAEQMAMEMILAGRRGDITVRLTRKGTPQLVPESGA